MTGQPHDPSRPDQHAPRVYTGVGSRRTPAAILVLMRDLAHALAAAGWTLRTGGAPGADQAFHAGARTAGGRVELFLPWPTFERRHLNAGAAPTVLLERPAPRAYEIAAACHPCWSQLGAGPRALMARNSHQVLGPDLHTCQRARLLICWTADGTLDGHSRQAGGTGQAIRLAHRHGVPVRNLARPEQEHAARAWLAGRQ